MTSVVRSEDDELARELPRLPKRHVTPGHPHAHPHQFPKRVFPSPLTPPGEPAAPDAPAKLDFRKPALNFAPDIPAPGSPPLDDTGAALSHSLKPKLRPHHHHPIPPHHIATPTPSPYGPSPKVP